VGNAREPALSVPGQWGFVDSPQTNKERTRTGDRATDHRASTNTLAHPRPLQHHESWLTHRQARLVDHVVREGDCRGR
jgi:hypothetical protein